MGYGGDTLGIPFTRGGLNHDPNTDNIPPDAMVNGSKNVALHENGRGKRGGTAHVNTTVLPGQPKVTGLYDFVLQDGTQFDVMATADGKIYKNETTTIKTGLTAGQEMNFEVMNDEIYGSNGANPVQVWDGAAGSSSDLAAPSADWTGSNHPKFMIKHGRGNSERIFAFGCPNNPNNLYFSSANDGFSEAVFTGGTSGVLYIETPGGLIGAKRYGKRLVIFSKTQAFILTDDSTDITTWGYEKAQWAGGVAHGRLLIETPNDLVAFTENGDVYSVTAADTFGDYKQASIAKPAFIDRWIREKCALNMIANFHAEYDPVLRAIYFFVVRIGRTEVDSALVYYIDRGTKEGWIVHDNLDFVSGFSASCSAIFRVGAGDFRVYTGGYLGFVWKLNETNKDDDSNGYYAGFKTTPLVLENVRLEKKFRRGLLGRKTEGNFNLLVNWSVDGVSQTQKSISMSGTGGELDTFILGTDILGGEELLDKEFDLGSVGKRIEFEIFNSTASEDFFVSQLLLDHKMLGARPS